MRMSWNFSGSGRGGISHLEILNMKERELGRVKHVNEINQLQQAINRHNAIELKRIIQDMRQAVPEIAAKSGTQCTL